MLKYILILLLVVSTAAMHPFHVSVCEIDYDQKTKVLQITQRVFLDDMETAIKHVTGKKKIDIKDKAFSTALDDFFKTYFAKHLAISGNNKILKVKYLGHEIEEGAVWCYLETEKIKKIRTVEIKNELLFETFTDQSNIVHIKVAGKTKSLKLTSREKKGTFLFNN